MNVLTDWSAFSDSCGGLLVVRVVSARRPRGSQRYCSGEGAEAAPRPRAGVVTVLAWAVTPNLGQMKNESSCLRAPHVFAGHDSRDGNLEEPLTPTLVSVYKLQGSSGSVNSRYPNCIPRRCSSSFSFSSCGRAWSTFCCTVVANPHTGTSHSSSKDILGASIKKKSV